MKNDLLIRSTILKSQLADELAARAEVQRTQDVSYEYALETANLAIRFAAQVAGTYDLTSAIDRERRAA